MKANFVIGKKQIILSALIVILGGAIYVNYLYANKDEDITQTLNQTQGQITEQASSQITDVAKEGKKYGDAKLVNGVVGDDYFTQAVLTKNKTRDETVETVKSVLEKAEATPEDIAVATEKIVEVTKLIEDEGKIENLIKAKGFEDCVVYLDNENANVVVKSTGLSAEQAAQIKNIVLDEKPVAQENISITEVQ